MKSKQSIALILAILISPAQPVQHIGRFVLHTLGMDDDLLARLASSFVCIFPYLNVLFVVIAVRLSGNVSQTLKRSNIKSQRKKKCVFIKQYMRFNLDKTLNLRATMLN